MWHGMAQNCIAKGSPRGSRTIVCRTRSGTRLLNLIGIALQNFAGRVSPGEIAVGSLLWIPLRSRKHLETPSGQESGYIIERFPGDDPSSQLAFLNEKRLARDLAEMLPLLRHIECVEHRGENNRFAVRLADGSRLMGIAPPRTGPWPNPEGKRTAAAQLLRQGADGH